MALQLATARTTKPIGGGGLWKRNQPAAAARFSSMQRASRSPSSGHLAMPAGLGGAPALLPRAAAAASWTGPLKGAAFPAGFGRATPLLAAAAASPYSSSGHLAMPAGLGGAPPLPRAAAAVSRSGPPKGVAFPAGFGSAAPVLAAASRSPNSACSGKLAMPAGFGGAPPLLPRSAVSRMGPLKGAVLAAWLGIGSAAPLLAATCYASRGETPSGDGDLEPSNTGAISDLLLQELKGINGNLCSLSRVLEETATFRFLLKRTLVQIVMTLLLASLAIFLIFKMATAMGFITDINGFLKNVFITFITDEEVRAKLQESLNMHADATLNRAIPWWKFVLWWRRNVGWF